MEQRGGRLVELDILRGFAVAVMILVTSPGDWGFTYVPLRHADWHGWSFADLVFPDFLFGVGMALGLTFGQSLDPVTQRRAFWLKALRRVILLIALGLGLNALFMLSNYLGAPAIRPDEAPALRFPGILQRIALCYLIAVCILVLTVRRDEGGSSRPNVPAIVIAILAILIGYWAMMRFVPVPGFGVGRLDQEGNLAAFIDRAVFPVRHMWPLGSVEWAGPVVYDPEGLLSTLPATVNVLFGVIAIALWRGVTGVGVVIKLLLIGVVLIALAMLADGIMPINKKIWTSSFALLTSGISFIALLLAIALVRAKPLRFLSRPFEILGGNAIMAFALSIFVQAFRSIPLTGGDEPKSLQNLMMSGVSNIVTEPFLASFTCAVIVVVAIFAVIWPLHRKNIHLRL